jgi:predicted dehydrogenase
MPKTVKIIIIGAGGRGFGYTEYAEKHPGLAKIVGVAEPRDFYRNRIARKHAIPRRNVFLDWKELVKRDKFADAVIIATQDSMHAEPAVAFAKKKYHILIEKPLAPTEKECRRIVKTAVDNKIIFGVCHVLRYTDYTQKIKSIIDSGLIGEVVNVQRLEPVGYWHFAHAFVRGNWRNESESSPMLLAKCCHDLDWIRYIMGARCIKVSSFGVLKHFKKEEKPSGAGDRCLKCSVEKKCPYSAKKIYIEDRLNKKQKSWPVSILTPDVTLKGISKALSIGAYGRCVYECDNDVVDNQVVNMLFEGNKTASFTVTAFNRHAHRKTAIFGTLGELYGDGSTIEHFDFLSDKTNIIETDAPDSSILGGHGGGDYGVMRNFVNAVATNDPKKISAGPAETLETHLMVFAAEKSRKENRVVVI